MSRLIDSSRYLGRMKELMIAASAIGGIMPGEHVERYFAGEEVESWKSEEENRVLLEVFWVKLMNNEFSRGAVPFTLIEEIQGICAKLEEDTRVNAVLIALKEGKAIAKSGTLAYMFEESVNEYRKKWGDERGSESR